MERWIVMLLTTLIGLGIGLLLTGRRREKPQTLDEQSPWRAVSPAAIAATFVFVALLIVTILLLAGPILALAAGVLLVEVAVLALQAVRGRHEKRVHDETLVLVDSLLTETLQGTPLADALRAYTTRHPRARLTGELHRFVLIPLAGGDSLVEVLNRLAEGPRYRPYRTFHRLLHHLARAVRGRQTAEELHHTLSTFQGTAEMVDEVGQELAVDVTQTRYTRYAVIGIIGGGILFIALAMPDARQHWLHDLVGQVTILLISLCIAGAVAFGERLAQMKGWRF